MWFKKIGMSNSGYDGLCISSGGYKGFAILGALAALEIHDKLGDPKILAGCSVGAVIIALRAVGWKSIELYKRAAHVKLFSSLADISLDKLKKTHGLISNEQLRVEFESLILEKRTVKKIPTLLELHNEGYYLAFAVCDKLTKRGHKIDYRSHPLLSLSDVGLMSANMPIIFPPIPFEGMEIIDGALSNPFPLNWIDNGKDRILGICVYGISSHHSSFMEDMTNLIMIGIEEVQRRITKEASSMVDVLEMQVMELNYLDSAQSYKIKNKMFFRGYRDGEYLISALRHKQKKERRVQRKAKKATLNKEAVSKSVDDNGDKVELQQGKIIDEIRSEKGQEETEPLKTNDGDLKRTAKKLQSVERESYKNGVRVPLREVPDSILLKCLMSQPLDILCQIAHRNPDLLNKCLTYLDDSRNQKLKTLARTIIADEIASGVHIKVQEKSDRRYDTSDRVEIKENHAKKIFDTLPTQFQDTARMFMGAMSEKQATTTVSGINLVVEGLKTLGIDIFQGFLLTGSSSSHFGLSSPRDQHDYDQGPKIEIVDEEPSRNLIGDARRMVRNPTEDVD